MTFAGRTLDLKNRSREFEPQQVSDETLKKDFLANWTMNGTIGFRLSPSTLLQATINN